MLTVSHLSPQHQKGCLKEQDVAFADATQAIRILPSDPQYEILSAIHKLNDTRAYFLFKQKLYAKFDNDQFDVSAKTPALLLYQEKLCGAEAAIREGKVPTAPPLDCLTKLGAQYL